MTQLSRRQMVISTVLDSDLEGDCLKHISDTKDLFIAGAFKIHV